MSENDSLYFSKYEAGSLLYDFNNLWKSEEGADTILESNNGVKFGVHSLVLAARSEFFRSWFADQQWGQTFKHDFKGDGKVLEEFVRFMYTDTVECLETVGKDLLVVAETHAMPMLKNICERYLIRSVTVGDCLEYLVLAETSNAKYLKQRAMEVIVNNMSIVLQSELWDRKIKIKECPQLYREILNAWSQSLQKSHPEESVMFVQSSLITSAQLCPTEYWYDQQPLAIEAKKPETYRQLMYEIPEKNGYENDGKSENVEAGDDHVSI